MTALQLMLSGAAGAAALMTSLWAWHRRLRNAGVVDVGWAACVGGLALFYGVFGPGDPQRRAVLAAMMAIWGARLAWYLLHDRVLGRPEDGRYADLLFRVTGIPATEAQAIRTRGDDYRHYQATTSAFVPWLPKG